VCSFLFTKDRWLIITASDLCRGTGLDSRGAILEWLFFFCWLPQTLKASVRFVSFTDFLGPYLMCNSGLRSLAPSCFSNAVC
jgi:hypothetical protein